MASFTFDVSAFRVSYPAFASDTSFPDATLEAYWDTACLYIKNDDYGYLNGDSRYKALTLMTAHLTAISVLVASGQSTSQAQSASVGQVSVSIVPPPNKNQFDWWLNATPYGQQLLVLLQMKSVGGMYIGGLPETSALRKAGGVF